MLSSLRISARRAAAAAPSAGNKLHKGVVASSSAGSSGSIIEQTACRAFATVPGPRLFDYDTVTSVLKQSDAVEAVEAAFGMLAKGKVDVPIPMHIGIDESEKAGPGDCHIKGGYISGTSTWTVKLANVSFYKNVEKGLPAGSGIFVVCDATNGAPLAIFQENRFLTDLRTGAAGAVSVKHFAARHHKKVGFVGAGVIAAAMARGSKCVHEFDEGFAYGLDVVKTKEWADEIEAELGYKVVELDWLRPHATIIASGSDQPTKNEIPAEVQKASKMVCDLVRQCEQVGELRSAIKAGVMTRDDVYAEIGDVVNGDKPGRTGEELILVDLTGTGAQDAAIGQVAWDILSKH
ncbi:Ornithine cyclodeaminase [Ectocarpus siliculosus]|uniref:Ornithine cyclodeaminase n=1 Tax=Ectocarpus siliculosus TaxID=2880 RepID=D8LRH6_ECTSI|nr:Ornithine cyclodeaminase [Ectocarpus siliculosus]|eukprot:CBN75077.1 Ornithine cyclodeaminase [Ectocarpus siliculosus]